MGLENTMFSEISQRKEIMYDITYIQSEKQNKKMYIAKQKQTHRQRIQTSGQRGRGSGDRNCHV